MLTNLPTTNLTIEFTINLRFVQRSDPISHLTLEFIFNLSFDVEKLSSEF